MWGIWGSYWGSETHQDLANGDHFWASVEGLDVNAGLAPVIVAVEAQVLFAAGFGKGDHDCLPSVAIAKLIPFITLWLFEVFVVIVNGFVVGSVVPAKLRGVGGVVADIAFLFLNAEHWLKCAGIVLREQKLPYLLEQGEVGW